MVARQEPRGEKDGRGVTSCDLARFFRVRAPQYVRRGGVALDETTEHDSSIRRQALWCLWGALLAAAPYTLRFSAVSSYETPGLVAPLQCAVPAVAAATGALAVIRLWNGRRLGSLLERALPYVAGPLAVLGFLAITLCELGFLPMRLGSYALLDWQLLFDATSGCTQAVSFLGWTLYGAFCVAGEESPHDQLPRRQTACAAALAASALLPVLAALASQTITSWPLLQATTCLLCGLVAGLACRRIASLGLSRGQLMLLELLVLGGLLCAAAFREASSEILFWLTWDDPHPSASLTALRVLALFAAFVACVAGASYLIGRGCKRSTEAPEPSSCTRGVLEGLPQAAGLSERQRDVLALAAEGLSRREISQRLGISVGTVGTHLTRGLSHLGFASTEELVEVVTEKGDEKSRQPPSAKGGLLASLAWLGIVVLLFVFGLPDYTVGLNIGPLPFTHLLAAVFVLSSLTRIARRESVGLCRDRMSSPQAAIVCLVFAPLGVLAGNRYLSYILSLDLFIDLSFAPLFILCASLVLAVCLVMLAHRNEGSSYRTNCGRFPSLIVDGIYQLFFCLPETLLLFGCGYGMYYLNYSTPLSPLSSQVVYFIVFVIHAVIVILIVKGVRTRKCTIASDNVTSLSYLTSRGLGSTEASVALLISRGYTGSQISSQLRIAKGTVNNYRAIIYRKLGIHSSSELKDLIYKSAGK